MLLQSGGGGGQNIQDGDTHVSGNLVRTVGRLEFLSLSLFLSLRLPLCGELGLLYVMERPTSARAHPSSACLMLATLSTDDVIVGGAYTRVEIWET